MKRYDIVIVGGGPAGLAAAVSAKEHGIDSVLILERDKELGGILNQCIHNGFGLHTFQEELTGPEYAARYIQKVKDLGISYLLNTMVMNIDSEKVVTAMNREDGLFDIQAKTIILAMGCRERSRGSLNTPGYRPAGIYSAGTAQRLVNMEGYLPGKEVVILGSGDIGLIMARRMALEGASVKAVAEIMPASGGLKRNIVQCLNDFDIPLKLSHTVIDIDGKDRVKGVTLAQVDENRKPISGTEEYISCDTLLLSCGLIPENELSRSLGLDMNVKTNGPIVDEGLETSVEGVFACGNVLHVHGLVDYVSEEAYVAGENAVKYIKGETFTPYQKVEIEESDSVGLTCIGCPMGCELTVEMNGDEVVNVTGNRCPKGKAYAEKEMTNPVRMLTSSVKVIGGDRPTVSCKTQTDIPKRMIFEVIRALKEVKVKAPVNIGDILVEDVAGTGVAIIATSNVK